MLYARPMTDSLGDDQHRALRASDSDRDRIAEVLREAAGEGRLSLDELSHRLDAVYAARTYAELEPIVEDLPASGTAPAPALASPRSGSVAVGGGAAGPVRGSRAAVGIMGGFHRTGKWLVPPRFTALAFWGGGKLDLREAQLLGPEVRIRAFAVMGGMNIVVPDDAEVHVGGVGLMGGFDHGAAGAGQPGGPRITVTGLAFWGGVKVDRRSRRPQLAEGS